MRDTSKYEKDYSESGLWSKISKHSKAIGKGTVRNALLLFYCMSLGKASTTQVIAIIGALGYLISPIDAIPDFIGPLGYTDDAAVLAGLIKVLAGCKDPEVKAAADRKLNQWFS